MNASDILKRTELTYRQLDYWVRRGWIVPERPEQVSTGHHRTFSVREFVVIERMDRLVQAGVVPEVAARLARGDDAALTTLTAAIEGLAA